MPTPTSRFGRTVFLVVSACLVLLTSTSSWANKALSDITTQETYAQLNASSFYEGDKTGFPLPEGGITFGSVRPVDLTAPSNDLWQRIRHGFSIPNIAVPAVIEKQAAYITRPQTLKTMFDRASIYIYYITEQCEQRGLPTELALIPFIESAFNPFAQSPARASGLWQFMPTTGRVLGLKQSGVRDDRRDIIASTDAALNYLSTLYDMYGDWHLALAAYNWGEGSVARAIDKNRAMGLPTDYLSLSMPEETRKYIPKLQAIKNIIQSPAAFNISLPPVENQPYFASIQTSRGVDIKAVAKMADIPLDELKALNPSSNVNLTSKSDGANILVPVNKAGMFTGLTANFDNLSGLSALTGLQPKNTANVELLRQVSGESNFISFEENASENNYRAYRDPYQFEQSATRISRVKPLFKNGLFPVAFEKANWEPLTYEPPVKAKPISVKARPAPVKSSGKGQPKRR